MKKRKQLNKKLKKSKKFNTTKQNIKKEHSVFYIIGFYLFAIIMPALIIFLFYKRFYVNQLPKNLILNFVWYNVIIMTVSFILLCYSIWKNAKKLKIIPENETKNTYILYIKNVIEKIVFFIYCLLVEFYELCWFILEKVTFCQFLRYHVVIKYAKVVTSRWVMQPFIILVLLLTYVPRILFTLASVYDIFWKHYFEQIYVIIPYMFLPFLPKILLFMLRHIYVAHIQDYLDCIVKDENTDNNDMLHLHPNVVLLPYNIKTFDDFFHNHVKVLIVTIKIKAPWLM